jgi:hypothetical protein
MNHITTMPSVTPMTRSRAVAIWVVALNPWSVVRKKAKPICTPTDPICGLRNTHPAIKATAPTANGGSKEAVDLPLLHLAGGAEASEKYGDDAGENARPSDSVVDGVAECRGKCELESVRGGIGRLKGSWEEKAEGGCEVRRGLGCASGGVLRRFETRCILPELSVDVQEQGRGCGRPWLLWNLGAVGRVVVHQAVALRRDGGVIGAVELIALAHGVEADESAFSQNACE